MQRRLALFAFGSCALLLGAASTAAQGWLDTARWYLQPTLDQFHYLADVNGDGFDDLFLFHGTQPPGATNAHWASFQVAFNDGTGQFPTLGPLVSLPTETNFWRPVDFDGVRRLEDVTGDGLVDVLLLEETPSFTLDVALHVFPGLGGGAFGAPSDIPLVEDFDALTLGQADADPAREIAIVEEITHSEHTRWWNWNGAGFTASDEAFIFGGIASPTAARLVALDLDSDGDDDLVFGQQFGQNLRTFTTVDGAPVLAPFYTVGTDSGHSLFPFVTDLAGGGAQDLLVVELQYGGSEFWFVPVLNERGTLVAGAHQPFVGGALAGHDFEPCDWDADGDTDLLAFNWQEPGGSTEALVAEFRNDGSDTFTGPLGKVELMSTVSAVAQAVSDLDHDGHLDAIGPQTIYFGRGRFENSPVKVTDFFYGSDPALVADAEGDGDLDELLRAGGTRLNDGTGNFPAAMFMPPPPTGKLSNGPKAVGDLTGDGLVDFLIEVMNPPIDIFHPATFLNMRLVKDNGLGSLVNGDVATTSQISPVARQTCFTHDFDLDGDTDVWGNGANYWLNDGAGHFPSQHIVAAGFLEAGAAGDLDGDGDEDLAAIGNPDLLEVLMHTTAADYVPALVHDDPFSLDTDSVSIADHDADGDLDLSVATSWSDSMLLFVNDGDANFAPEAVLSTDVSTGMDPALAVHLFEDIDGDGITDLLAGPKAFGSSYPNKVALFRATGSGYEPARWYVGAGMGGVGDADGDGDLDLLGRSIVKSRLFDGPSDGIIRQYGTGTPALSEVSPVLGAAGPLRPGSPTAALKVARAVGGKPALLLYGFGEAAIPGLPFQSSTLYVQQPFFTLLLVLGGTPGVHGDGELTLGLTPVLPAVAGITVYHQLAVFGGPGNGKSTSNGLQLTYGL